MIPKKRNIHRDENVNIMVLNEVDNQNHDMQLGFPAENEKRKTSETIILSKAVMKKKKENMVCPVCNEKLVREGIVNESSTLYVYKRCGRYNIIVPEYVCFFNQQVVLS